MYLELIHQAREKGADLIPNLSGGKDGQAMAKTLANYKIPMSRFVHADLGRVEWPESLPHCYKIAAEHNLPLHVVKRKDGLGLLEIWQRRMIQLLGQNKPFWSSSQHRYCTSDLKRDPINAFYTATGSDFIISAEGLRASESRERAKKIPLTIRKSKTSSYYDDMTVEEAIHAFTPGKKLVLTWYPIFHFSTADVWATYNMSVEHLALARSVYKSTGKVPDWWPFHPAYAYGNDRVSCRYCILGQLSDLQTANDHDPDDLLGELIRMEEISGFTFKHGFSLKSLRRHLKPLNRKPRQLSLFPSPVAS